MLARIPALVLVVGTTAALAAPNIPSSELPGRERQRYLETPTDRFTQPPRDAEPL